MPGTQTYWDAWRTLRFDRHFGDGGWQSPILFAALDRYGARYGIEGEDFETLVTLVLAMDEEYREHIAEAVTAEMERAKQAAAQPPPPPSRRR